MGGGGALSIAVHHPDRVVGVVALAGISDFVEYANGNAGLLLAKAPGTVLSAFGGTPESAAKAYRHMSAIHAVDKLKNVPVYLIHGDKDTLAPVEDARTFVERLREVSDEPVLYAEMQGAQHAFEVFPSARTARVIEGVERFLSTLWARRQASTPAVEAELADTLTS